MIFLFLFSRVRVSSDPCGSLFQDCVARAGLEKVMHTTLRDAKPCEMQNLEKRTGKMYQYRSENSFPATLGTMPRVMSRACNLPRTKQRKIIMPTQSTTQTHNCENSRPYLTSNCNLKRVFKIHFAYKRHSFPSFLLRVLKAWRLIECWTSTNCLLLVQTNVSDMKHDGGYQTQMRVWRTYLTSLKVKSGMKNTKST